MQKHGSVRTEKGSARMPDREKVIKGLEICSAGEWDSTSGRDHTNCPYYPAGYTGCTCKLLMRDALALLKEQEPSKYEYHTDHTDCPWYISGEESKCPVTCSQYRDGWNDAMNYIFRNGDGYRPYDRIRKGR